MADPAERTYREHRSTVSGHRLLGDQAMGRQGSMGEQMNMPLSQQSRVISRACSGGITALALALLSAVIHLPLVLGDEAQAPANSKAATTSAVAPTGTTAPLESQPIDHLPYRIELHLALDPSARIDTLRMTNLLKQWKSLVHRFVGPPWIVKVANRPSPLSSGDLSSLEPESVAKFDPAFDKIWLIRIAAGEPNSRLVLTGREYDTATRRLGPLQERRAILLADSPR